MSKKFLSLTMAGAIALSSLAPSSPVLAAPAEINEAKAGCLIGEKNNGYLGEVAGKTASAKVLREMRSINQLRRAEYEKLAARNGVTVQEAATATAERLINRAPSGHCVQNAAGQWIEKP
ncbi:MAG: YdbL family protein [Pseudomonadota bacterium]